MGRARHLSVAATLALPLAIPLWATSAEAQAPAAPPPAAQPAPPPAQGWFPPPQSPPPPAGPPQAAPPPAPPPASPPAGYGPPPYAPPTATPPPGQEAAPLPPEKKEPTYPAKLRWDPGDPIPAGFEPTSRPHLGLLVSGAIVFGVAYIPSLGIAAGDEDTDLLPLAIPVAGPFITMGTAESQDAATFWLGVDGVAQIAGATMFITSFIARQTHLRKTPAPLIGVPSGPHADLGVGAGSFTMKGGF